MEGGLPGNREMQVTYTLTDDNELLSRYFGLTDKDTLLAPTNHSYFNLNGHDAGPASDHFLRIDAEEIAAEDDEQCPTGAYLPVEGTVWDFRSEKRIGQDFGAQVNGAAFPGYDECFIVNGGKVREEAVCVAVLSSRESGIVMEVYTDMPSVQLYTANLASDEAHTKVPGKGGRSYPNHAGIAIETQYVPNAVNIENAEVPLVKAGEQMESLTVYRFTTEG
jgi:aldose 1-epimerase